MEKCVELPTENAISKLKKHCNSRAQQYLQEHGINESLIHEVMTKEYTLKQISQLECAAVFCDKAIDQSFIDNTVTHANAIVEKTVKDIQEAPKHANFQLTLRKNIEKLQVFNWFVQYLT